MKIQPESELNTLVKIQLESPQTVRTQKRNSLECKNLSNSTSREQKQLHESIQLLDNIINEEDTELAPT